MKTDALINYKTSHIPLAAWLVLKGCPLAKIYKEGSRGVFEFSVVIRDFPNMFNTGQSLVEPNEFATKMSQLTQTAKRVMIENGED